MRLGQLLVSLALGITVACEDPTLLIGARPVDEPDEQEPAAPDDVDTSVQPARPAPAVEPLDATVPPAAVDAGGADAQRPSELEPMDPDRVPDFRPDEDLPPRSRFAYRCRADRECARVRGVCERGWCVQCRSFLDCPALSVCTPERICARQR